MVGGRCKAQRKNDSLAPVLRGEGWDEGRKGKCRTCSSAVPKKFLDHQQKPGPCRGQPCSLQFFRQFNGLLNDLPASRGNSFKGPLKTR